MGRNIIERKAFAKVNLVLDVVSEREDGYHEVRMVMQNLGLHDTLKFALTGEEAQTPEEANILLKADSDKVPTDERNLIIKAIRLMYKTYNLKGGMEVELQKKIPVEAGMAGGSTDAAAAFHAVNELYGLGLTKEALMELGVKIGADVPYCIFAHTALSEGIGEVLTPVAPLPDCYVLVAKPPVSLSTKEIYEGLKLDEVTHPDVDGMVQALNDGDLAAVCGKMGNVLETVSVEKHREIEAIKQTMMICHASGAIMTGSGPTVFGLFENEEYAKQAYDSINKQGIAETLVITHPER